MVRNVVNVVEDRCGQGQFAEPFRSRLRQNIGFADARRLVSEEQDHADRTKLNRIDLVRNLVKTKASRLNSYTNNQQSINYGTPNSVLTNQGAQMHQANSYIVNKNSGNHV